MKAVLKGLLIFAVGMAIPLSTAPASAQMSPAQLKAQKDRAAREAAARAEAERQRKAAAARASQAAKAQELAEQRQRTLKADVERRARAQQITQYADARNKAVASGKISVGYMIGSWAYSDPSFCKPNQEPDFRTDFNEDGSYSGYESGGSWSVYGDRIIWDYTDYDDNKIHAEEIVSNLKLNSFVVEVQGGHEIWFRCGDRGPSVSDAVTSRSRFPQPFYEDYDGQWDLAQKIDKLWSDGRQLDASRDIYRFIAAYPKITRVTSRIKNYAGLYEWKREGNRQRAATWFLQNYQDDPSGERAADSLLSLAHVMHEMGDIKGYCLALKKFLADYPFDAKYRLEQRVAIVSSLSTCL